MSELRADSWASSLTEEQRWSLYYKGRTLYWQEAVAFAQKEYNLPETSRSSWYRFVNAMRADESNHRLELQRTACLEAAAIAKESPLADDVTIAAYMQMGIEETLRTGNAAEGLKFVQMAMAIADRQLKKQEIKLKKQAQETKDKQLRLAREKFEAAERRLAAAAEVVASPALTPEQQQEELKRIFGLK